MASFYLTLNSDGSRNMHPNNHGGNFTVELHNTLDLPGIWEVALIEMTYFGQLFGNILDEYGIVTISSTKTSVYPTKFVVDYHNADKLWIQVLYMVVGPERWISHGTLRFPKPRQYTWKALKKAFKNLKHELVMFEVKNNILCVTPINSNVSIEVKFSPFLVELLTLEKSSVKYVRENGWKVFELNITEPNEIIDDSIVLFTPDTWRDIWIRIDEDAVINIPKIYCTINQFNKLAFNNLFKFTVDWIGNEWIMSVKYSGDKNYNGQVTFSASMQNALGLPHETMIYCGVEASSSIHDLKPKKAPEVDNSFNEIKFKLNFNYYPTSKALVENLNNQCVDVMYKIATLQHSEEDFAGVFRFRESDDRVFYVAVDQFTVKLTNHMLNVLNLEHTNYSNAGIAAATLPSAVRPFLHVYCNLIMPQYINDDEHPLLRVINNNALADEKTMKTFADPHYYQVSRRYISSIHTYITDHVNSDPLIFIHPISYLLHFRQK